MISSLNIAEINKPFFINIRACKENYETRQAVKIKGYQSQKCTQRMISQWVNTLISILKRKIQITNRNNNTPPPFITSTKNFYLNEHNPVIHL
jgi:hypothetical protein